MPEPTPLGPKGPAWKAAEDYGFDMSVVECSLRRTPAERLRDHARVLSMVARLRTAMRKKRD